MNKLLIIFFGLIIGAGIGFVLLSYNPSFSRQINNTTASLNDLISKKQKIGFLPYWLIDKAHKDYSGYINTLTYFGLTINSDGSILKLANEQEEDPGWHVLRSGSADVFFNNAKNQNIKLSLLVFNANDESIGQLLENPEDHAKKLVSEVKPIMQKYKFTNLNLDIENFHEASEEARKNFTVFVKTVKKEIDTAKLGTLTIEASPTVLIKPYLINVKEIEPYVDYIVFMNYDYHYQGSSVTGPVSPLAGGGTISEFDNEQAINEALKIVPANKIIVGVPLYGYEWETLDDSPRSAVIPGTGITASNLRVEEFLKECATCSAKIDKTAEESYLIYKDTTTDTFHQIFYPDKNSTNKKIEFAKTNHLGGIALWALGYEGKTILEPLKNY